ncbi:MAG: CaiB/BaiF CoA-transferase family protein [Rubrivivax sp.]|nr:CaiB/BaiF CoA-transferase family protein [Rubrivivax sp.]MDP3082481.1 CaiB/BaiF CoA-transferase family protein [Rubrivivax sp.]
MLASNALSHLTVIDLTRVRAGPTAVRQLADWGAKVIKVEMPPGLDEGEGIGGPRDDSDFQNVHRNKRGITLNLKSPEGVAILKKLVASADVLVENYRPDVKERLGIDYATMSAINPRLIYGSISGYGEDGPYRLRPGFDQIAQGMGGLMSITGEPGQGPMRVGIPIADLCAGIFCAYGIAVALIERDKSGLGQWVQSSLLQAQLFMLDFQAARWLMKGEVAKQAGNNHPTSIPTGVYRTRDGHMNIAASGHKIWLRLCEAIDLPALPDNPDYKTGAQRSRNRDALHAVLEARLLQNDTAHWIALLNEAGVPCGPIYNIDQAFTDPQAQHLGMAQKLGEVAYLGQPVKLSRTPSHVTSHPPALGEHTQEVLRELGYEAAEIEQLTKNGIV